jgi:hypothetical protein
MKTLLYRDMLVEIKSDDTYTKDSSDNVFHYDFIYCDNESSDNEPSSKIGVILKKDDKIVLSAILCGVGGATGVHDNSVLIDNDKLLVCVANKVFCLSLPDLHLIWITNPDWASCFQIFKTQHGIIVHGEAEISSIDLFGKILWSFSGADIFVTPESGNEIELTKDYINLVDWNGKKYQIDYNGKLIK